MNDMPTNGFVKGCKHTVEQLDGAAANYTVDSGGIVRGTIPGAIQATMCNGGMILKFVPTHGKDRLTKFLTQEQADLMQKDDEGQFDIPMRCNHGQ